MIYTLLWDATAVVSAAVISAIRGLCVQVLCGRRPDDRVYAGASLYTCVMCVLAYLTQLGI